LVNPGTGVITLLSDQPGHEGDQVPVSPAGLEDMLHDFERFPELVFPHWLARDSDVRCGRERVAKDVISYRCWFDG
jgi:hypothetical protein